MPTFSRAILNPRGPNYEHWFRIFGHNNSVPLVSPEKKLATLGAEKDVEVYLLNLNGMTLHQRARLLGFIANKFNVPIFEVQKQIERDGFPIRANDVILSYDILRAFL
jgi:hypothetical protein